MTSHMQANALSMPQQWTLSAFILLKSCAQVGGLVVAPRLPNPGGLRPKPIKSKSSRTKTRLPPVHVRYDSIEEITYIKAQATKADLSINGYIRHATLSHACMPPHSTAFIDEIKATKRQLTGIGINLNQLMRSVNAGRAHPDSALAYVEAVREPVMDALKLIRKALSRNTDEPMP